MPPTTTTEKIGEASAVADLPKKGSPVPAGNGKQPIHLTALLEALQAMKIGDFSVRMAGDSVGIEGKIADTFNEIVTANQRMAKQLERVGRSRCRGMTSACAPALDGCLTQ